MPCERRFKPLPVPRSAHASLISGISAQRSAQLTDFVTLSAPIPRAGMLWSLNMTVWWSSSLPENESYLPCERVNWLSMADMSSLSYSEPACSVYSDWLNRLAAESTKPWFDWKVNASLPFILSNRSAWLTAWPVGWWAGYAQCTAWPADRPQTQPGVTLFQCLRSICIKTRVYRHVCACPLSRLSHTAPRVR